MSGSAEDPLRVPLFRGSGVPESPAELVIPASELVFEFARSGGPGGQNVNKVETKAILRFDVAASPSLDEEQRRLVSERLESRLTKTGELVLHASSNREHSRNVAEARERLTEILADALRPVRTRRATRPTRGSKERRLAEKRRQGDKKRDRRSVDE